MTAVNSELCHSLLFRCQFFAVTLMMAHAEMLSQPLKLASVNLKLPEKNFDKPGTVKQQHLKNKSPSIVSNCLFKAFFIWFYRFEKDDYTYMD